jgi:hypothetical protein
MPWSWFDCLEAAVGSMSALPPTPDISLIALSDARGQLQALAPQQTPPLFNHLVDA